MIEKTKIADKYDYWYFDNQIEFFDIVNCFLKTGFQITDHIYLGVELSFQDHSYFMTYQKLDEVTENFKEDYRKLEKQYKLVLPNYSHCMLNTISSLRAYFNCPYYYDLDPVMNRILQEKNYQNMVILLLDGLGENVLDYHLDSVDFLKKYRYYTNTAIYPSTTAAATTSIISGKAPLETGWLGWENYIEEINQNIILFNGKNYYTDEPTGVDGYHFMPYKPFFEDMDICGKLIMPTFQEGEDPFSVFEKSLSSFDLSRPNIQYVYCTDPDKTMHEFGTYSVEAKKCISCLNQRVEEYVQGLPENTLCIITADHGHTPVKPIEFWNCSPLLRMLERPPANDSRAITFKVKKELHQEFVTLFKSFFDYAYDLYPSDDLLKRGFFGPYLDKKHARVKDFLGDFMAIAKNEYHFNYKNKDNFIMKSHHAGYTADEMLVPMIIYRK